MLMREQHHGIVPVALEADLGERLDAEVLQAFGAANPHAVTLLSRIIGSAQAW